MKTLPHPFKWIEASHSKDQLAAEKVREYDMKTPGQMSDAKFYHLAPSEDSILTELAKFNLNDNKGDPQQIHNWVRNIRVEFAALREAAKAKGYLKISVPTDVSARRSLFKIAMCLLAKPSTAGDWPNRLGMPLSVPHTRAGLFYFLGVTPEKEMEFYDYVEVVYQWLKQPNGGVGCPMYTYGKNEAMKRTKLEDGCHRTIQCPDLSVQIVQQAHRLFAHAGLIYTWDDVAAMFSQKQLTPCIRANWAFGRDLSAILQENVKQLDKCEVVEYDVKQWDRTLPMAVINAIYQSTIDDAVLARNVARAQCGQGTYITKAGMYRLNHGIAAWCSGSLDTLLGNSIAHSALHNMLGYPSMTMGDDANVWVPKGCGEKCADLISKLFKGMGMSVKGEAHVLDHFEFCARWAFPDGRVLVDAEKIEAKGRAHSLVDLSIAQVDSYHQMGLDVGSFWLDWTD